MRNRTGIPFPYDNNESSPLPNPKGCPKCIVRHPQNKERKKKVILWCFHRDGGAENPKAMLWNSGQAVNPDSSPSRFFFLPPPNSSCASRFHRNGKRWPTSSVSESKPPTLKLHLGKGQKLNFFYRKF
ncbi:hypothetical protein CDAR_228411 [Caerostris darwini]|uniref:Uncharacterized protein n=1 Tax=Caerostris darwini TaxID=1538125 RepID=A0AAV4N4V4_9ARAC|nr:hypothetical protein CDAR_228411 [Caerostris darwini]